MEQNRKPRDKSTHIWEARGGGVSVRSLIISTSETYCKFISKMSAWLGFPLEEGHSGEKKES